MFKLISEREENRYNDSYFWALVWDTELKEVKEIQFGSTAYPSPVHALDDDRIEEFFTPEEREECLKAYRKKMTLSFIRRKVKDDYYLNLYSANPTEKVRFRVSHTSKKAKIKAEAGDTAVIVSAYTCPYSGSEMAYVQIKGVVIKGVPLRKLVRVSKVNREELTKFVEASLGRIDSKIKVQNSFDKERKAC
jgi:hypothetical protein